MYILNAVAVLEKGNLSSSEFSNPTTFPFTNSSKSTPLGSRIIFLTSG
jgi:hypothetical protein